MLVKKMSPYFENTLMFSYYTYTTLNSIINLSILSQNQPVMVFSFLFFFFLLTKPNEIMTLAVSVIFVFREVSIYQSNCTKF